MTGVPDFENYPISQEELGKRYKNWTEWLAGQMVMFYKIGKEVGGDKFVQRLKEEHRVQGQKGAQKWMKVTGTTIQDYQDCKALPKLQDAIDDCFANYWEGYIENSEKAFEKEIYTCPVAKQWSKEPEMCDILIKETVEEMYKTLNPKFRFCGFSTLLTKGDKVCRFRAELDK